MANIKATKFECDLTEFLTPIRAIFSYEREKKRLKNGEYHFSDTSKKKIDRFLKNQKTLLLYWPMKGDSSHLHILNDEFDNIDIALALQEKGYFSHYSALFIHGLTNQVPKEFYLSEEIKKRKSLHTPEYNEFFIEQQFMKPHRSTTNYCQYKNTTFYLLEKNDNGGIGVETIDLPALSDFLSLERKIRITSLERTLIDIVEAPQYAGGILSVVETFRAVKGKIDLLKLKEYYNLMNFFYPYWQTIGFLIEKTWGEEDAQKWMSFFGKPIHEFYLDRKFKLDWDKSEKWQIRFPKGLFE